MNEPAGTDLGEGVDLAELLRLVRRIEAQSERLVSGVMAGGYQSVFRGSGIEFEEIREYVDGDDPRAVDQAVTARMGRPFVRTYVEERDLTMVLLLDLSASMLHGGFGAWSTRQTAARVAACLALSATHNDDKVGLVAFGERVEHVVPAKKGTRHVLRIVRDCLALPGATARTDVAGALEHVARTMNRHAVVFVLSDFLDAERDDERFRRAVALCARHHEVVAVRLLPPELDAELLHREGAGMLRTIDPESGRRRTVDFGSKSVRTEYAARVAAWRERLDAMLRRARVATMDVEVPRTPDDEAIAGPILRFFAARQRRGAKR